MSKPSSQVIPERDCEDHKCRSKAQGALIVGAITKRCVEQQQLASYINSICSHYGQRLDHVGRSALHVAASCGLRDLCYWLIKSGQADINAKDLESGYTPLHRSIFYGHINVAVMLMQLGANAHLMDKDDLQPADHAMKDRLCRFSIKNPSQVYVWGVNNNYTLGIGNQHSRQQPDLLDFFRKSNISIKQVAMDKFHSVFVSHSGKAWACGHGQGGRLGLDTEKTVLTPLQIKTGAESVEWASVAKDHTILLMESGMVYTCGLNTHHLLGLSPPPPFLLTPRAIQSRVFKVGGETIVGVCAARYHSVFWTKTAVFTCGLHAGQLGHAVSPDKTIIVPKMVTGLGTKECRIVDVAASDGATVIAVKKGDIYVLHQYQTRKIASRLLNVEKVCVVGGELNAKLESKLLLEKGGEELKVLVQLNYGNLLFWDESYPQLTRCIYPLRRNLTITCIAMNRSNILLTTEDGEAYLALVKPYLKKKKPVAIARTNHSTPVNEFNTFLGKDDCRHLKITRIPNVHRAVTVTADPKGRNFSVVQSHPKLNLINIPVLGVSDVPHQLVALLEESHEDDTLHDIVFQIGYTKYAAHRYILALSSEELASLPQDGSNCVKLTDTNPQVFQQILYFVYTGDCALLHPGSSPIVSEKDDVLKGAFELAKRFKLNTLIKRLQNIRYEQGMILLKDGCEQKQEWSPPQMDRKLFPALYDVKISSNDSACFKAHKCVLAARLEYFHNMLAGDWIESDQTNISLPYPQTVLRLVLDFLYTDTAPELLESDDVDYICSILVVADQLFITRLGEICEKALSNVLNLRNAACLLQFASTYNAHQLQQCCIQFICLNLTAMLENRTLEILNSAVLDELSKYYHEMIPAMSKRIITPFSDAPSDDDVIGVANNYPVLWHYMHDGESENEIELQKTSPQKSQSASKKKLPRVHKSSVSGMQRKRYESVNSNSELDVSMEVVIPPKSNLDDSEQNSQEWIKVDKTQKSIQNRLKVITTAATIQPPPDDFVKLVPQSNFSTSPPFLTLDKSKEFPQLSGQSKIGSSPRISGNIEIKRSPPVKLSQKQRKKLASESSDSIIVESPSPPVNCWATINQVSEHSFTDIIKQTKIGSPSESSLPKSMDAPKFLDIVADEMQQRDNLSKMKTKSLQLTQLEDKAMDDLRLFYNASNIFEERITVHRVLTAKIAKPTWITSRRQ